MKFCAFTSFLWLTFLAGSAANPIVIDAEERAVEMVRENVVIEAGAASSIVRGEYYFHLLSDLDPGRPDIYFKIDLPVFLLRQISPPAALSAAEPVLTVGDRRFQPAACGFEATMEDEPRGLPKDWAACTFSFKVPLRFGLPKLQGWHSLRATAFRQKCFFPPRHPATKGLCEFADCFHRAQRLDPPPSFRAAAFVFQPGGNYRRSGKGRTDPCCGQKKGLKTAPSISPMELSCSSLHPSKNILNNHFPVPVIPQQVVGIGIKPEGLVG